MTTQKAPILVTGAAGHVGANLVHRLVEEGKHVRVLLRKDDNNEAVEGLGVEKVYGDLRDDLSLRPAIKGVKNIFHVASMVSTIDGNADHRRAIYETNVIGTRHLLRIAKEEDAGRVVVTGSFSAVGYDLDQTDKPADETMAFYPYHRAMPYERSKVLQEHEVLKACVDGQEALIATSCAVVGGHDYLPSRMGRTMCRVANGEVNAYVPGGFPFVAARDLIDGHIRAMDRGRPGQKYILATKFMSLDDIFDIWEDIIGIKRPTFRVPSNVLLPVAELTSFVMTRLAPKKQQLLTPGAIRRLRLRRHANTEKAERELGFITTSLRDAFMDAYRFHWERGEIKNPNAKAPEPPKDPAFNGPNVAIHA